MQLYKPYVSGFLQAFLQQRYCLRSCIRKGKKSLHVLALASTCKHFFVVVLWSKDWSHEIIGEGQLKTLDNKWVQMVSNICVESRLLFPNSGMPWGVWWSLRRIETAVSSKGYKYFDANSFSFGLLVSTSRRKGLNKILNFKLSVKS